ncbi:STAS domain-containing protein [Inediibacterium massiliense]|uniref:STAS domain-containing protein n=1 Tax=Inediibacterium massiliense TaxID=1658111 RepID=UPI0006B4AB2D|nr:STAS domain-containing protein [Inediibacterium massiliense]
MSIHIQTNYQKEENVWLVNLQGEIDIYTANQVKESLNKILDEQMTDLKIDCFELTYIDSTGLGVLIGILKRLKIEEKNIKIINPRPNISKLFHITGLDKIFLIEGE